MYSSTPFLDHEDSQDSGSIFDADIVPPPFEEDIEQYPYEDDSLRDNISAPGFDTDYYDNMNEYPFDTYASENFNDDTAPPDDLSPTVSDASLKHVNCTNEHKKMYSDEDPNEFSKVYSNDYYYEHTGEYTDEYNDEHTVGHTEVKHNISENLGVLHGNNTNIKHLENLKSNEKSNHESNKEGYDGHQISNCERSALNSCEQFSHNLLPSSRSGSLSLATTLSSSSNDGIKPSQSLQNALHLRHLSRNRSATQSLIPFLPSLPQQAETRDNLVMPAYKNVYDAHGPERMTKSWLYTRGSLSHKYSILRNGYSKLSASDIGFVAKQLEKAMPVPVSSVYLTSSIKLSDTSSILDSYPLHSNESENVTKILHPETIGQLLRANMIDQVESDEDLVTYLKNFIKHSEHEMIAQHQIKAQSIFVDYITSIGNLIQTSKENAGRKLDTSSGIGSFDAQRRRNDRMQSTITRKEIEFMKLNHREDLIPGVCPSLHVSSHCLTFNTSCELPAQIGKTLTSEIVIKNKKKPLVVCILKNVLKPSDKFTVSFENSKIELKKNQSSKITVSFLLKDYVPKVEDFLTLEISGGARHFIGLNVFGQTRPQFGVNPEETEQVYFEGFGEMPRVLIHLLTLYTELAGRRRVGIFRRAGHETRMKQFKLQLNRGEYPQTDDYNSVANLIKIWFRELPTKIFDHIDADSLIQIDAEDPEVCASLLDEIPEPYRRLFNWLLSLMADVAENREENKMDPKNLAIVFSPNLYSSHGGNPAVMIMITQKLSQLVCSLIKYFMEYRPYQIPTGSAVVDSFVDPEYIAEPTNPLESNAEELKESTIPGYNEISSSDQSKTYNDFGTHDTNLEAHDPNIEEQEQFFEGEAPLHDEDEEFEQTNQNDYYDEYSQEEIIANHDIPSSPQAEETYHIDENYFEVDEYSDFSKESDIE